MCSSTPISGTDFYLDILESRGTSLFTFSTYPTVEHGMLGFAEPCNCIKLKPLATVVQDLFLRNSSNQHSSTNYPNLPAIAFLTLTELKILG